MTYNVGSTTLLHEEEGHATETGKVSERTFYKNLNNDSLGEEVGSRLNESALGGRDKKLFLLPVQFITSATSGRENSNGSCQDTLSKGSSKVCFPPPFILFE